MDAGVAENQRAELTSQDLSGWPRNRLGEVMARTNRCPRRFN